MFWDDVTPVITARLEAAVERGYDLFERYRLSGTIIHCDCPCCMTSETAADLTVSPLREISESLLAEYTNSAHGYDRGRIETEFKHFLPRYFDLIAQCRPPSPLGLETCLSRLRGYRAAWPAAEVAAVDEFFDAFAEASVRQSRLLQWPVGLRLEFDLGDVLVMVVEAGGDLDRVLAAIDSCADPMVAVHLASLRLDLKARGGNMVYVNAFLDTHPHAARTIGAWLLRDCVTERIVTAAGELENRAYDDILDLAV